MSIMSDYVINVIIMRNNEVCRYSKHVEILLLDFPCEKYLLGLLSANFAL